jgi:hypothetical protein
MLARRFAVLGGLLVALSLGLASTSQAQGTAYPLAGGDSGLQYHIGNGLALPIQAAIPNVPFPAASLLLVPEVPGAWIQQTAGPDPKAINIVYPVIEKLATYAKVGVFFSNPSVYQVGTNLSVQFPNTSSAVHWEAATAAQTATGRTGATTTTFVTGFGAGNKIVYSNALAQRFGGPGKFFVGNPGTKPAGALFTGVNATVWAVAVKGPGNPPCKHTALGGANPACVAALAQAVPDPTATGAPWGATAGYTVMTPGGTPMALSTSAGTAMVAKPKKGPEPGIQVIWAPAAPTTVPFLGSIALSVYTMTMAPTAATGFTNMASSTGYPWTTGMIVVSAPMAGGVGEKFTLSGMDTRVGGVGAIQLVTGTLSRRSLSGPNANRAWLRLNVPEPSATLGAACGFAMLALCHGLARRRSR